MNHEARIARLERIALYHDRWLNAVAAEETEMGTNLQSLNQLPLR